MSQQLLTASATARRLGIAVTTLYDWLGQSDYGLLQIRGQSVTVRYYQSGRSGQGRILIEPAEVERILDLMRVTPRKVIPRQPSRRLDQFPGINVPLGRPVVPG